MSRAAHRSGADGSRPGLGEGEMPRPGYDRFAPVAATDAVCGLADSGLAATMAGIREDLAFPDRVGRAG